LKEMPAKRVYRVFHLIKGLGRGGAEKLLSEGIRYADAENFNYGYGYFLDWKNALVKDLEEMAAPVHCFRSNTAPGMLLSAPRVAKYLKDWRADLIHCHLPMAGISGRFAGRLANIPVIYTEHNVQQRYHRMTRIMNRWTWHWQAGVVAVSNEVAASIRSSMDSSVPVYVVQNGIAADAFVRSMGDRIAIRSRFQIPQDAFVVGTVAGFRRQKNLNGWVKAARMIRDRHPNIHFLVVGEGPLRSTIEKEIDSCDLRANVHLTGIQENVVPMYSAMDLYMISSIFEGLPISLLEAMAMRLPVVSTPAGGIPEVLIDGVTGYIVDFQDIGQLAKKTISLINNHNLCTTMGEEGRSVIEKQFGIKKMVRELERIYLSICESYPVRHQSEPSQNFGLLN
jgi:L-malate glycosyltransferase